LGACLARFLADLAACPVGVRIAYLEEHVMLQSLFFDLEQLELRRFLSATVESIDGSGNNLANPTWGSAGTDLLRLAAAAYADGIDSPALPNDLSARAISNLINSQADPNNPSADIATVDQNSLSDFGYVFGQFMDHDMDLTPDGGASFDISVAADDPIGIDLPFTRSQTDPATGTSTTNPAQQVNTRTSYLDLSQIYGSTQTVADALRTFKGGLLKTSPGNMLPYDNTTYFTTAQIAALDMANDAMALPESQLFAAGDRRANENVELTAVQTLFVRNHNQIASQLHTAHPAWTDEQLYQEARKLNIAQYQSIVYNEWIPALLGQNALPNYRGYNSKVNASISNEFSTVAFRFGHSLLSAEIERQTNAGTDITGDPTGDSSLSLAYDFFDSTILSATPGVDALTGHETSNIGAILKGDADGVSQATDTMAVQDVRNLLFGNGGMGGEDLMARDVQRDRDNGIPDYNSLRVAMGLPAVTSFAQITSDVAVQQELAAAYPGGVNTIDAFEGGLAEDHVTGSDVGPLFQAIMVDQFTRLRNGDRFFYQNENFTPEEMRIINQGNTLAETIENNTNITNLQSDVMVFRASVSGTVFSQTNVNPRQGPNGIAGVTVDLLNGDGDIVATTLTDRQGNYFFNQLSGPAANVEVGSGLSATGQYTVQVVPPAGSKPSSVTPATIMVTRGDTQITDVNFALNTAPANPPPPPPVFPPPTWPQPHPPGRPGPGPGPSGPGQNQDLISSFGTQPDAVDRLMM
jgi:peroxidase